MSDPERYTSRAVYREEDLYYDLGFRFSTINGKKPAKAFSKDYTLPLLGISFAIQIFLGIGQVFTILTLLVLFLVRYLFIEKSRSPIFMMLIIIAHIYDYQLAEIIAQPGKIIQGKLTSGFWVLEIIWVLILAYQFLIIFQPFTPVLAVGQSVKAETLEARENYSKMKERLKGSDYDLIPLNKLINIEKLQKTLMDTVKLVLLILVLSVVLDVLIWQIIYSLGGGNIVFEQYVISGMSLILFIILVSFSNLISPDKNKEKI